MFQGSAIVLAVLFAASPGCSGTWDSSHPDTLAQVVDDGIVLRLEGLRDTYTLDDTVSGAIVLVNQSSEEPFFLQTGSLERITWSIARRDNPQPEFYEPTVGLPVEWRDTLDRGDTIATGVRWRQETCYPAMPSLYYMKAFSGEYRLRGEMWGNPHLQDRILTKSFRITEEGDSLASCLVWHFSKDSLNFDFVVRNRTSRLL